MIYKKPTPKLNIQNLLKTQVSKGFPLRNKLTKKLQDFLHIFLFSDLV